MRERNSPVAAATATGAEAEIDAFNVAASRAERQPCSARPHPDGPFADAAEILRRAGLTVIPLIGDGDGKPPNVSGFTRWQRRPGLATLTRWSKRWPGANVGIVTGKQLVVVDLDSDDPGLVKKMIERFGPTPLQVATPSGGRHLYYRSSGERSTNLRASLPVDIKGMGGYVVAPPSIRPSGEFAGRSMSWLDCDVGNICFRV
jgi:hypothetical protein